MRPPAPTGSPASTECQSCYGTGLHTEPINGQWVSDTSRDCLNCSGSGRLQMKMIEAARAAAVREG